MVHDGNRLVISQELDPVAMAAKVEALRPPPSSAQTVETTAPEQPQAEDTRPLVTHFLGASVLIPDRTHPERAFTLLQLQDLQGGTPPVSLWANVNFLWLTGRALEVETPAARHAYMLMASPGTEEVPSNLAFPADGSPGLVTVEGSPTAEQLAPLEAVLDYYDLEHVQLRENYERTVREAAIADAERRANPPEKKDLIIRWWRADEAARTQAAEGGGR